MKDLTRTQERIKKVEKVGRAVCALSLLLVIVLLCLPEGASASRGERRSARHTRESGRYVVSLLSDTRPIDSSKVPTLKAFRGHTLYKTKFRAKNGVLWYRLRLGFFPTKEAAEEALMSVKGRYRDAWVVKVSPAEREKAPYLAIRAGAPAPKASVKKKEKRTSVKGSKGRASRSAASKKAASAKTARKKKSTSRKSGLQKDR